MENLSFIFQNWIFIVISLGIVLLLGIIASGYVKAPPDMAYIISGYKKEPKILIGRAGIKIPFLERKDVLIVKQVSIDIKTNGYIPTQDFIGVDIDAVAKVKIKTDKEGIKLAMKNFLNMSESGIAEALTDSLQGNMREIIGTVDLKELCTDRKKFGDEVQAKAQTDMNALGIEIISCNIQKIEDEKDLIIALGQDNMSKIQKTAQIAQAESKKEVAIAVAQASKESNDAEVKAQTDIAINNNKLEIKKAELKKEEDKIKAEADSVYQIAKEEQRKNIEIATADANIARQEKEIEVKQKEVQIQEQSLNAEVRKKADAKKYAIQQEAEAQKYTMQQKAEADLFKRKTDAEARLFEQEKEAQAQKTKADARKYEMKAEAEGIKAKGEAEAKAIELKGKAEAEALEKKAEAMSKMDKAAILEMYFNTLPSIAKAVAEPLSKVDKISMYGEPNGSKLVSDIIHSTTQINEGFTDSLGIDLKGMISGFLGGKIANSNNDDKK